MSLNSSNINRFLSLRPLGFQVLTVLCDRPLHGYGIVQAAQQQFSDQPALEIGSLLAILIRRQPRLDLGSVR